jgi:ABC-type transporter MlaC component
MKRTLLVLAFIVMLIAASAVHAQTPEVADVQKVLELVKALQAGQAQISDNQGKIDAKIAALVETIRVAKIEASRGGGKHIPPSKK